MGHKPCIWDGYSYIGQGGFGYMEGNKFMLEEYSQTHARKCSVCGKQIMYSYYLNQYGSGNLYNLIMGKKGNVTEYCCDRYGNKIDCDNPVTCAKCNIPLSGRKTWKCLYRCKDGRICMFYV